MPNYSKNDVVLVCMPYTDLSGGKVRPGVVVNAPHAYIDLFVIPLTSQVYGLAAGEFVLSDWAFAGLNVQSAIKRGIHAIDPSIVIKRLARLSPTDATQLDASLRLWLGI